MSLFMHIMQGIGIGFSAIIVIGLILWGWHEIRSAQELASLSARRKQLGLEPKPVVSLLVPPKPPAPASSVKKVIKVNAKKKSPAKKKSKKTSKK